MKIDGIAAVTGAGQGIGLGVTAALAGKGFDVLALVLDEAQGKDVADAVAGKPGTVTSQVLDVTEIGDFSFPASLQVLVNNAGVRMSSRPIEAIEADEWRRTMDVNFFGMVDMTRLAIPVMRAAGRGTICNISSGSLFMPIPFLGPYRASKAAISAFSETLRIEMAPFGIRVVEILPGAVKTAMNVESILNKIADTSDVPVYQPMAELQRAQALANPAITATPWDVGTYIVDAIFDERGPQRYGSDANSEGMLEVWRTTSDETLAAQILAGYQPIIPG